MARTKSRKQGEKKTGRPLRQQSGELFTPSPEQRTKLRVERLKRDWKQSYVAKRIGVSTGTISNIETGKRNPQARKSVYAKYYSLLFRTAPDDAGVSWTDDPLYEEFVANGASLSGKNLRVAVDLIKNLTKPE